MLIDSNVLVYAIHSRSTKNTAAQAFIQSQSKLIIAQQNIFETLRILTHPKFPHPVPTKKAIQSINAITKHSTIIWPTFETEDLALNLIKKYSIQGSEIFDSYLVATALSHGIKVIATDNVKHLGKYQEITVINPFK